LPVSIPVLPIQACFAGVGENSVSSQLFLLPEIIGHQLFVKIAVGASACREAAEIAVLLAVFEFQVDRFIPLAIIDAGEMAWSLFLS